MSYTEPQSPTFNINTSNVQFVGPPTPPPPPKTPEPERSTPPPLIKADSQTGVEPQAFELAKMFMDKMGNLARKCQTRGQLSELYLTTIASWATEEVQQDELNQRHFKQVLFAIAHGMKLVRVRDTGRSLFWNRYRDNHGNQLEEERAKFTQRGTASDTGYHDRRSNGYQGEQRGDGYQGDRRSNGYQGDQRVYDYQGDRRSNGYQGDQRGNGYQGEQRGNGYQGDQRGNDYQGDRQGNGYQGDRRGNGYQGDRQGNGYQGDRRGGHQGNGYQCDRRGNGYQGDRRGGQHGHQRRTKNDCRQDYEESDGKVYVVGEH